MSTFRDVACSRILDPVLAARFPTGDDGIEELAQSIDSLGLLQPVVVVETDAGYRLVAGTRRLAACRMLGWETIPANVVRVLPAGEYCATLAENLRRRNLNPLEEAYALAEALNETGLTQATMGQRLGMSQQAISARLQLLEIPEKIQTAVGRGELAPSSALEIARIWEPESQSYYLTLAVRQGATRNTVRDWVAAWLRYNEPGESQEEDHSPAKDPEPWPEPEPATCVRCGRSQPLVAVFYELLCPDCAQVLRDAMKGEQ